MSAQFFEVMNDENILSKIFSHLIDVLMNTSDPATSAKLKEILKLVIYYTVFARFSAAALIKFFRS